MSDDPMVAALSGMVQDVIELEKVAKKRKMDGPTRLKKPPVRQVSSDSYHVDVDGQRYYPHLGETVTFRPSLSLSAFLTALDIQGLNDVDFGQMDREDREALHSMLGDVCGALSQAIVGWTWTDDLDVPLPPPSEEVLRSRPIDEIMWLVGVSMGASPTEAESEGEGLSD